MKDYEEILKNYNGEGDLNLSGTKITSLPEGLKVGGYLNLSYTKITSLPEGLKVGGFLELSDTKITSLPKDLKVGRYLELRNTSIISLPKDLRVGGRIYLHCVRISLNKENDLDTNSIKDINTIKILISCLHNGIKFTLMNSLWIQAQENSLKTFN